MKILFAIFGTKESVGGHFHSLVTVALSVSEVGNEVEIVCIGEKQSQIIINSGLKSYHVSSLQGLDYIVRQIRIISSNNFDCSHCFDVISFYFVNKVIKKSILTKCGGVNPRYFPASKLITLFSNENYRYFRGKDKYRKSQLILIPNRVMNFQQNEQLIEKIRSENKIISSNVVFLKISRIAFYYELGLMQSIELFKELSIFNKNIRLIIIGIVQDVILYEKLELICADIPEIVIKTEKEYYDNPKMLIDICDFYIGSGRSLMEAAYKGKILLCHTSNNKYPVLIKEDNFEIFFDKNFSERVFYKEDETNTIESFIHIINRPKVRHIYESKSKEYSNDYFDISKSVDQYLTIYKKAKYLENKLTVIDSIQYTIYILYTFYKLYGAKYFKHNPMFP